MRTAGEVKAEVRSSSGQRDINENESSISEAVVQKSYLFWIPEPVAPSVGDMNLVAGEVANPVPQQAAQHQQNEIVQHAGGITDGTT